MSGEKIIEIESNGENETSIQVQWFALENQQSPFYVVNEVTLT